MSTTCKWCQCNAPLSVDGKNHIVSDGDNAVQPCDKYTMIQAHRDELRNLCELYGIHGVIAVMAEWSDREGGLGFVQRVVADLTESKLASARTSMRMRS